MQSKLGRVRGMGAAHAGYHHWHVERVTAIALVPLTLWFIVSVLRMLGADQPAVAAWAGRPLNAALLLALVAMTFQHTQLGLQVIYEDYIHMAKLRNAVALATKGVALVLGLMGAIAVLKLAFAAH
jgi:succinate dehydrogenase / fumarate reductase membrane anchor subunit